MFRFTASVIILPLFLSSVAHAQVTMEGKFIAAKSCAALTSIKKSTNPGNVSIVTGKTYPLLGTNKQDASHYRILMQGTFPPERWVEVTCGTIGIALPNATAPEQAKQKPASRRFGAREPSYALALSWEPTFCEVKRNKAECKYEKRSDFQATNFVLHGLWPQPRRNQFCKVDARTVNIDAQRRWDDLPEPKLTPATRAALDVVMPGTKSDLERHEWIKHGTCYPGGDAETYFKDSIRLTAEVNASAAQDLLESRIGQEISARELRASFDQSFGKGAGNRVQFECDDQGRFSGLTINLRGDIPGGANMADLLKFAEPARNKCDEGYVDPAG